MEIINARRRSHLISVLRLDKEALPSSLLMPMASILKRSEAVLVNKWETVTGVLL